MPMADPWPTPGPQSIRQGGTRPPAASYMPKILRRLFVPTADAEAATLEVRHVFRRFVQSSITPPLVVETMPGGIVVDFDVRIYDNYRVDPAIAAVREVYPDARVLPGPDAGES